MGQRRTLQLDDDPDDVPEELPDADPDVPPVHEPLTQVPPANVQLLQSEPPVPHAVSDWPGSHSELVLQQPAAQFVVSHPTVPLLPLPPTSLLLPPPLPTLPLAPALLVPLDVPSPEALPLPPPTLLTSEPLPLPTPLPVVRPVSNRRCVHEASATGLKVPVEQVGGGAHGACLREHPAPNKAEQNVRHPHGSDLTRASQRNSSQSLARGPTACDSFFLKTPPHAIHDLACSLACALARG